MAQKTHQDNTTITWVTTLSSTSSPANAQLTAGVDLTTFVPKDGLKIGRSSDTTKNDSIANSHKDELPGSYGEKISVVIKRNPTSDAAWTALKTRGTAGYLVVRRSVAYGTAYAAAQLVEVYPATTQAPEPMDTAENEVVKFTIPMVVTSDPVIEATVA